MIFGNFMILYICAQLCSHTACSLLVILQGALWKQSFFYAIFNSQNNIGSMRWYPELRSDIWQEFCHRQHFGNSDGITPVHHKELLHTCGCVFCYVMLCYIKVRVVCMLPSRRIQYFFRKSLSLYPKTWRITATLSKHNKVKMILQQICK